MTSFRKLVLFAVLLLICAVYGRIETLSTSNDDRSEFLVSAFGFETGVLELTVEDLSLGTIIGFVIVICDAVALNCGNGRSFGNRSWFDMTLSRRNPTTLLFYSSDRQAMRVSTDLPQLQKSHVSIKRVEFQLSNIRKSFSRKQIVAEPGLYHLYFSNCEPLTQVSFKALFTMYNIDSDGVRNYLAVGETNISVIYFCFTAVFALLFLLWVVTLARSGGENTVKQIHHLMTAVLCFKTANIFFEAFEFYALGASGGTHGWNIPFHIFSFLKGIFLFGVVVLVGTGWSLMKPFLTDRDRKIIYSVLGLQVLVNIAMVVLDEESHGDRSFITVRDFFHVVDLLCCCAVLFPIMWSIHHLQETAESDDKAVANAEKLARFRSFYLSVITYVYFTRIVVYLLKATLSYSVEWISVTFREVAAVAFYATTGYLFRPQSHNPYLALNTDDAPSSPSSVVHSAGTELTHRGGGSVLVSIEDGTTGDESDDDGGDLESERLEMSAAHASAGSFLGKSTTTSLST